MLHSVMRALFYPSPGIDIGAQEAADYEAWLGEGLTLDKLYALPYDPLRMLRYLATGERYLFHGSNNREIARFEPRKQTLYNGKPVHAVFASAEPLWSVFYAVFDRRKLEGSFRNGCLAYGTQRYHYYSLNQATMRAEPWTSGALYVLPRERFRRASSSKLRFDEWICEEPVEPLLRVEVQPQHFVFRDRVAVHGDHEPVWQTWLRYKSRTAVAR